MNILFCIEFSTLFSQVQPSFYPTYFPSTRTVLHVHTFLGGGGGGGDGGYLNYKNEIV